METLDDLDVLLPRLDSNQQPFGEQPLFDVVRQSPDDRLEHRSVFDHSRPESMGFNCGKTAADLGAYLARLVNELRQVVYGPVPGDTTAEPVGQVPVQ